MGSFQRPVDSARKRFASLMADQHSSDFNFDKQALDCVVGGVSVLDIPQLHVHTPEEAQQFIAGYGYNIDEPEHLNELWSIHRRAVTLIKEQILDVGEQVPERLCDPAQLADLRELLIIASQRPHARDLEGCELQRWACAILRVMHVYVHMRHDLFGAFRDEIQAQILKPIQGAIHVDEASGRTVLGTGSSIASFGPEGVELEKFEIKPFKTTASAVVKLLARPERVALQLLDKLGVRIVTRTVYDSFRAIRFLVDSHLISFPHIIPDQSNNTLYPVNLFLEVMDEVKAREHKGLQPSQEEVEALLKARLESSQSRAEYFARANEFSGHDYRFIKFINRKLIIVNIEANGASRKFGFFYPYEIQIVDHETYQRNLAGPMAHEEYKSRQRRKARARVLGGLCRHSKKDPTNES
jgi:uncharacterized protein (TIGR04562 family)